MPKTVKTPDANDPGAIVGLLPAGIGAGRIRGAKKQLLRAVEQALAQPPARG